MLSQGPEIDPTIDTALGDPLLAALRNWRRRLRLTYLAVATTLVIVTLPYWEVLLGRRTAMYGDVNDFYVPAYIEAWRTIRAGRWPWWTPNVFAGHSMVGAGQFAVFYPLNAVFGWLDPVTAYRWWLLGHVWIAALGAFAWSWHRWRSRTGAVVSGVAYALSGFFVLHLVHPPFIAAAAWLPYVFLGVDLVAARWSARRAALVAVPLALIAFAGQPQSTWIVVIGCVAYTFALAIVKLCDGAGAARVATALACGVGIGAIQLLPVLSFGRTSVRPSLSLSGSFENAITPHHLLMLGFPYLYGGSSRSTFGRAWLGGGLQQEVGNYVGITVLALAIVAVFMVRRDALAGARSDGDRPETDALRRVSHVRAIAATAIVALLIAMGGSTPLGHAVYVIVVGAREFRDWGRTLLLANLAVAMLAGAGVRAVLRRPGRALVPVMTGAFAVAVLALFLPYIGLVRRILAAGSAGPVTRAVPVVLLFALVVAIAVTERNRRAGAVALVFVCALDMVSFAYVAPWHGESASRSELDSFYASSPPSFGLPYDAPGGVDRWASDAYAFRSVSLAKNMLGVNGYDPLMQRDWAETAGGWLSDGYPTRPDLWSRDWTADVLRVTTLILSDKATPTDPSWTRASRVPNIDFTRWVRAPRLPEAYLVGAVDVSPIAEIRSLLRDPQTRLRAVAYVEARTPAMATVDRAGSAGRVDSADVLGSGKVVVDATRDAFLVLSHDWESGWHASVDGGPARVLRTDGLVIGIAVPRGHHVVRVGFRPPGLDPGLLLALLAVTVLMFGAPLLWLARSLYVRVAPARVTLLS